MKQIKESINILKNRWPEITLILGLSILALIMINRIVGEDPEKIKPVSMLSALMAMVFMIISTLLRLGFLRSICIEESSPKTPVILLKIGSRFFWRIVLLSILYLACILAAVSIASILPLGQDAAWKQQGFIMGLNLGLIKYMLFLPALIVALDCKVSESFTAIKTIRLTDAKELIIIFCIAMAIGLMLSLLPDAEDKRSVSYYIINIVSSAVSQVLAFLMAVMAVKVVNNMKLGYHQPKENLQDSGDSLND